MLLLTAKNCLTILCYDKTITNLTISCQKPKCSFLKTSEHRQIRAATIDGSRLLVWQYRQGFRTRRPVLAKG